MKKHFRILVLVIAFTVLLAISGKLMSQPGPPPLPDQHGYNGSQSQQGAPLDGGSEVLLFLGIVYAIKKMSDRKKRKDYC